MSNTTHSVVRPRGIGVWSVRGPLAWLSIAVSLPALAACLRASPPPSTATTVGAPLPAGWVWPVSSAAMARGVAGPSRYRPVHDAAVRPLQGTSPCAPVEVAPFVWARPLCSALPRMALSPRAASLAPGLAQASSGVDLRALGLDGPVKDQQQAGVRSSDFEPADPYASF